MVSPIVTSAIVGGFTSAIGLGGLCHLAASFGAIFDIWNKSRNKAPSKREIVGLYLVCGGIGAAFGASVAFGLSFIS